MREIEGGRIRKLAGVAATLLLSAAAGLAGAQEKRVLGVTEPVRLEPEGVLVNATLDTGASTTSLDARAIRVVDRDGKPWVEFEFHDGGHVTPMARPLVRVARLRSAPGVTESRPVVMMQLCMGGIRREVRVNLVDRSDLRARMLIGRNFLIDARVLVDSAAKMTSQPVCEKGGA